MKPQKFSCLSGSVASAAVLFMLSIALLANGAQAQSTAAATVVSLPSGTAAAPFLVAPSFALAGAPSSVAMGDLNQDGKPDLVTADAVSGKVTVFLGIGNGKFAPGVEYATGSHPGVVAVADLNGDGRQEVIVGDASKGTISVLASNGSGALELTQSIAAGIDPAFLAVGDFNGDGKIDLAAAPRSAGSLAILLNDGKGNLQKPALSALSKAPASLSAADFNNDGHADLALANADGTVSIRLGAGDGTFHAIPDISVASSSLSSIAVGDFDRDGNIDLAVTQSGGKALSVLLGKGNGGFAAPVNYTVGNNPVSALVTDLDGDGHADLVVINQGSNTYSVLGGNGDGTFRGSLDYVVGNGPVAAVAGQFDANGHIDLAVINPSSQSVTVPLGNGDGTFKAARSYLAGVEPRAVASADLNGDKLSDLVVTNYCGSDSSCGKGGSVAVFLANPDGSYKLANTYQLGTGPVSVALADVNGDKFPDIVALNRGDKTVSVLLAKGDGSFEQPFTIPLTDSPIAVAVGDFNKDGKIDLAILGDCGAAACSQPGSVEVLTGHGDGSFGSATLYPTGYSPVSLAIGDLNQDKSLDIVVANRCGADATCKSPGTATVLLGGATGKFKPAADVALGSSPSSIALGDMSGRGIPDLLVSSSTGNTLAVLHGNGDGSFQAPAAYKVGNTPGSVVVADFNGDGKPDVAVANVQDSTVSVLFGKGDGTLNSSSTLSVGAGPASLTAVVGPGGSHASLVTANGNTASATPGTDFTVLANIQPDILGTGTATITVTPTPGGVSVDGSSTFNITVNGTSGIPSGNVTVETTDVNTGVENGAISTCSNLLLDPAAGTASCTTNEFFLSLMGQSADVFQVDYTGDSNYAIASQQFNVGVSPLPATLSVNGSPTAPTLGQSVTFTATVTAAAVSPVGPSGSVAFLADGASIAGCPGGTPVAATATTATITCATNALTAGQHNISVQYSGPDFDFTVSPPFAATSIIVAHNATLGLALSPATPAPSVDTPATFIATLSTDALTPIAPSGKVVFAADGVQIASCTPAAPTAATSTTATVSCTTSSLTSGPHSITATYLSDPYYSLASPIASLSQTIAAGSGTIGLTSSSAGNTSTVDSLVTFTATLNASAVSPNAPNGKISFTAGGNPISSSCTAVPLTTGATITAICQTSSLAAPSQSIVATYIGDSNFDLSTGTLTQTVNPQNGTLALSSSSTANTSTVDTSVTFTATLPTWTVTPLAPNGTVNFTLNGNPLCTGVAITPSPTGGNAKCVTSALTTPSGAIVATYNNDTNFTAAAAPKLTQTVNPEIAPLSLSSSAGPTNKAPLNTPLTFTATLTPATVTPTAPAGTISFTADGNPLPNCSALAANFNASTGLSTAACASNALPVSATPHSIAVTYTDTNGNFTGTPPTPLSETVTQAAPSLVVSSSAQSIAFQAPVTFTATLTGVPLTPVTPTFATTPGTVTFSYTASGGSGSIALCSAVAISSTGTASCVSSTANGNALPAGADNIIAVYTGDSNFATATSPAFPESVGLASAGSVNVQSSAASSSVNQLVTFTATVKASTGGPLPLGNVTFNQIGVATPLCGSQPLTALPASPTTTATATCAFTFTQSSPTASPFMVTATYDGNTTYGASTSPSTPQTVSPESLMVSLTGASNGAINQPLTFTATLTPTVSGLSGAALPTAGTVTFSEALGSAASTPIPNCTLPVTGSFTYTCSNTSFMAAGTYTVKAVYAPSTDPNFTCTGTACSFSQTTVIGGAATYAATTGPSTGALNTSVSIGTTVSSCPIGPASPSCVVASNAPLNGTITYSDSLGSTGSLSKCNVTVTNQASPFTPPACTVPLLSAGVHAITATFTPTAGGSYNVTSSTPVNVSVSPVPTTVAITNPTTSPAVDESATFVVTVTPSYSTTTPTVTGPTAPTGTVGVSFNTSSTPATALCTLLPVAVVAQPGTPTTTTLTTVSASCTGPLPVAGSVSIVATFVPGDSNFATSTSTSTVTVLPASVKINISPLPSPLLVNQVVTLTATLTTPSGSGTIIPTGFFTFSDTSTSSPVPLLCATPTLATGSLTANCPAELLTAGIRTVTATFTSANSSFSAQSSSANVTIASAPTAVHLLPSSPTSVATQPVEFTALVQETPPGSAPSGFAYAGTAVPNGTVTFTASDGSTPSCGQDGNGVVSVTSANQSGSASASCAFSFNPNSPASVTVTAAYSSTDNNFLPSTGTENQTLENFSVAFTPSAPVTLTQGDSNANDPFNPAKIMVNSVPNSTAPGSLFADLLNLTCQARDSSGNVVAVTVLSCSAAPSPFPGNGTSPATFSVAASSTAPAGLYSATITATDTTYPALSHSATLPIYVVSSAGTLSLGPGTSVTESLTFNTAPPPGGTLAASLDSFACGQIFHQVTQGNSTTYVLYSAGGFTCVAGVSSSIPITVNSTLAPVTIAVSGTLVGSTSKTSGPSSTALASFWGVPLLALLVWLGNRKSPRRNFFRFLGVLLLVAGLANVIGCGGSFTAPKTPTGGPPVGTYLIQVVATDSNGITHTAVVPLVVN